VMLWERCNTFLRELKGRESLSRTRRLCSNFENSCPGRGVLQQYRLRIEEPTEGYMLYTRMPISCTVQSTTKVSFCKPDSGYLRTALPQSSMGKINQPHVTQGDPHYYSTAVHSELLNYFKIKFHAEVL